MMAIPPRQKGKEYRKKFNELKIKMENINKKIKDLEKIETGAEVIILTGTTTQPLSKQSYGRSKSKSKRKSKKRKSKKRKSKKRKSRKRKTK